MSCPDWKRLTEHRYRPEAVEPSGWNEALEHLESCPTCRRAAVAADPTLAFQRLGREVETDVEAIRQGVRVLRRTTPLERQRPWRWIAAAAVLTLGVWVAPTLQPPPAPVRVAMPYLDSLPLVETVDRPTARIYQLTDDELDVVLIVDESFDV